jgi:BON domain
LKTNWDESIGERAMSFEFKSRLSVLPGVLLGALACCGSAGAATSGPFVGADGFPLLQEIVVTGNKNQQSAADVEMDNQIKTAMKSNRTFYDAHVAVESRDGVVFLRGLVFDDWDLRAAIRISKRVPGVKKVVNELIIGAMP